jgi:hypothetical protein
MTTHVTEVKTIAGRRVVLTDWQRSALLMAVLIGLPFFIFGAEALGQRVFYLHDLQYYFYPYHKLIVDYVHQGYLPLWNPYAFSGIPLLGDGQTAMFYPPNWFFFFLPATTALNYAILTEFSIAGAGMFVFARGLALGRAAALLAALAYMFNGFIATRMVHLSIIGGAALLPFVFWSVDRLHKRPGGARVAVAALAVALQALAGHPQVPVYTLAGLTVYLLVQELAAASPNRMVRALRAMAWLIASYVVGYSLAAIQLLPWIDFARLSPRAAGVNYDLVTAHSVVGSDWLLLILPYIYGGVQRGFFSPRRPFLPAGIYVWERAAYVGILPLALAVVALLSLRRRNAEAEQQRHGSTLPLAAVLLLGVAIASGRGTPIGHLVYAMPVLGSLRAYSRAIVLLAFTVPALAAIGLQQLIDATVDGGIPAWLRSSLLAVAWLLGVVFIFVFGVLPSLLTRSGDLERRLLITNLSLRQPAAFVPLALALVTIGMLLWWSRYGVSRRPLLAIGMVAADLIVFAAAFNPTTPAADFSGTPPSVAFLQRDRSPYRTATFLTQEKLPPPLARAQLAISWSMVFGIESINGFNSLQPRRYTDVLFGPEVGDVSYGFLWDNKLLQPGNHVLSMLNTKYVLIQPGVPVVPGPDYRQVFKDRTIKIYRNLSVFPRAYFVSRVHTTTSQTEALAELNGPEFNPRSDAIVEADLDPGLVARLSRGTLHAQAALKLLSPNRLQVTTNTSAERFLVLSEMYMPGWYARIDGHPTSIYRSDYLLRGLIVPAGKHTIDLVYRPWSAIIGAILSAVTALGLLVAARRVGQTGLPAAAGS